MFNRWILLAILAALSIGAVAAFVVFAPAPSDETGTEGIVIPRGPVGAIPEPPETIRWNPVRGARSYRVDLFDARGERVWSGDSDRETIPFPEEMSDSVRGGGDFFYRITAKGRFGGEIVSSQKVLFRCKPPRDG